MILLQGFLAILLTVIVYLCAKALNKRYPYPFTLPILVGTVVIIAILLCLKVTYETYYIGAKWIEYLLGPAVVALAYPLYKQLPMLKTYFLPILISVITGAFVGVLSGIFLAFLFGIKKELVFSLVPKSVTAPVAMGVAHTIGGIPTLAAVLVVLVGIAGAVLSSYLFVMCKITSQIARGMGIGCSAHAIGTAKALENGEREGAASSIAMTLSAIIVSVISPLLIFLFY